MIETGLKDKVVIVTGAAAGIGRATAERFVAEGCKVAAWDVNRAPESAGVFQEVNVANAGEVEAAVADVVDRWGSVFVLINNAGILRDAQLVKFKDGEVVSRMTDEAWDAVIGVNLKGVFNCCKFVAVTMSEQQSGKIVNIASASAQIGNIGQVNYAASKGGVISLTKTLAKELAQSNINVNAVAPGFIETPMTEVVADKVRDYLIKQIPLARAGRPQDVANAVVFLASDMASYITGQIISCNGGMYV